MEEKVMKDCKVLALCSQKGGVGKTTSCVNLAVGLAKGRYKVNKRCGKGRSAVLKDTGMIHAFDYIRVEGDKGEKYDIMFSRFFISDDNSVNCKLCAYQFGFSEKTMSSYLLYPKSCEAKEKGSLY